MEGKEKKVNLPNECSWPRWIAVMLVGFLIGTLIAIPYGVLVELGPYFLSSQALGAMKQPLDILVNFGTLILGFVISLRVVGKTSVRDFVLGVGGKINWKASGIIVLLYVLGIAISTLTSIGKIEPRGVETHDFIIFALAMIPITFIQTTCEELYFRGVFGRMVCKNELRFSKRAVIVGVISSLLFMAAHFANPEMLKQQGVAQTVIAGSAYFVIGMGIFSANLYFNSLIPGIIIHFINNYFAFVMVSGVESAGDMLSFFVDHSNASGIFMLLSTVLVFLPVVVYMIVDNSKKKKLSA